jgi:hypothetical protein
MIIDGNAKASVANCDFKQRTRVSVSAHEVKLERTERHREILKEAIQKLTVIIALLPSLTNDIPFSRKEGRRKNKDILPILALARRCIRFMG